MNQIEILKKFLDISKESGSLSTFLKMGGDSDNLREDLMRLLYDFNSLGINDPPEKFDKMLDSISDCELDINRLSNILNRIGEVLFEIYDIILNKYIPDDYYDDEDKFTELR